MFVNLSYLTAGIRSKAVCPIQQFLNVVSNVGFRSLQEYKRKYGYGTPTEAVINGKSYKIIPLAHPRQIGALGDHSEDWYNEHKKWEDRINK